MHSQRLRINALTSCDEDLLPWDDLLSTNLSKHYTSKDAYEDGLIVAVG